MTSSQFYALMIARRAMGDLGTEVELSESGFDELVETSRGRSSPINPCEARSRGWLELNSCNGPTLVFRSGMRPELYFKSRAANSTTKTTERDKTTEEVIAERFQGIDKSIGALEKWRSELSNRVAVLENQALIHAKY